MKGVFYVKRPKNKTKTIILHIFSKDQVISKKNAHHFGWDPKWIQPCERKSMKNCARKWCRKPCAFLFVATWAFQKMCLWNDFSACYLPDKSRLYLCPKWLSVEIIQKCRNRFAFLQFSPHYSVVYGCWCYVVVSPKRRPSKNQKSKTVSNEDLDLTFPHFLVNHRLPRLWRVKIKYYQYA